MELRKIKFFYFIIVALLSSSCLVAQQSIVFVEPNVSFRYDTAHWKVKEEGMVHPANTGYVVFRRKQEQTEIRIDAGIPANASPTNSKKPATLSQLQKFIKEQIASTKKYITSGTGYKLASIEKKPKKINDFWGYGWVQVSKERNTNLTILTFYHISDHDYTVVELKSYEKKSLAEHYKLLEAFLRNFKAYTKAEISNHLASYQNKYTIVVKPATVILPEFKNRTKEYLAVVSTREKMEDRIDKLYIKTSYSEEFEPTTNGEVYIACPAPKTGTREYDGQMIIHSSIGKKIRIPFRVTVPAAQ